MTFLETLRYVADCVFVNSLKASILIGLIFLIRGILRHRIPVRLYHYLWLILIIRLLLPTGFESKFSLYSVFQNPSNTFETASRVLDKPVWVTPIKINEPDTTSQFLSNVQTAELTVIDILAIIWIVGALLFATITVLKNLQSCTKVRKRKPVTNQNLLHLFSDCLNRMKIRFTIRLEQLDCIKMPMLYGCLKPSILLPSYQIEKWTSDQLRHIICHELAHFKQRDIFIAHITTFLQILHWFNPLIWLAFYKMRLDREVSCDAIALSYLGQDQAKSYGTTILSLLENISNENLLPMMIGIIESKGNLKRRLSVIMSFKRTPLLWSIFTIVLIAGIGCCVLTEAKESKIKKQVMILENMNLSDIQKVNDDINIMENHQKSFYKWVQGSIYPGKKLFPFRENDKFGYKDSLRQVVIEPQFERANYFSDRITSVKKSGKWGFIDTNGEWIIEPRFEDASGFCESMAYIRQNGKYGFVNSQGKLMIEPQFDKAYPFTEGLTAISQHRKYGFIDKTGQIVIAAKWDMVMMPFQNGEAVVIIFEDPGKGIEGGRYRINKSGKIVSP